ncbi:MAG: ATPase, T2SS/T4P/T4SS family, partial [Phycisphaerales bacterium]
MNSPPVRTSSLDAPKVNGKAHADEASALAARPPAAIDEMPTIDPQATKLLTPEQAARLQAVPYGFAGRRVLVAMAEATDDQAADEAAVLTGKPVARVRAPREVFDALLRSAYGATASQMGGGAQSEDELLANLQAVDASDIHRMAENPSVINLVNLIILEAVKSRASDVHVEPFDRQVVVKYRIDGDLRAANAPPKQLQAAITSRIKI